MPAISAMRFNPVLSRFAGVLKGKGKPAKVIANTGCLSLAKGDRERA
jgi:hypothetical protein